MKLKNGLTIAGALSFVAVLVCGNSVAHAEHDPDSGAVYVYRLAICNDADDSSCHMLPENHTPVFPNSDACAAYAKVQMQRSRDPKEAAFCVKMWEA